MTEAKTGHLKHSSLNLPPASKEKMSKTQKRHWAEKRRKIEDSPVVLGWVRK